MYDQIQRLRNEEHLSIQRIADRLGINFRTVKRYLEMSRSEFESFSDNITNKPQILTPYTDFVVERLSLYQDTSTAQMHDWLKEAHPFTSEMAVIAHEKAFEYFHGIPKEIIYDQDAVFLWDENLGAIRK